MDLAVRLFPDPVLRQPVQDVTAVDGDFISTVASMITLMRQSGGIGLAAPQVGIPRNFFVAETGKIAEVFINPRIVEASGFVTIQEGCLSFPGQYYEITRPERVTIQSSWIDGSEMFRDFDGITARCMLHEIDHLQGRLFIDYLKHGEEKHGR